MMFKNLLDLRKATVEFAAMPVLFVSLAPVLAQSPATQPAAPAAIAVLAVITVMECMGSQCVPDAKISGTWKFSGILGTADWNNGAEARGVVERFDEGGVDIRRIDLPNSSSYGQTAVYTGTVHGDRIEGDVVWSWNGHWNDEHPIGHWSAVIEKSAPSPPAEAIKISAALNECEADQCAPGQQGGCLWTFNDRQGEARCRDGAHYRLEVQKFDTDGIAMRRTEMPDSVSAGLTALYTGKLRGDRITGIGTWSWPGHWNNHNPSGRWFATVAEGDHVGLPPVPGPLISPEVHPDGSVTFRALAPASLEVFVQLEGEEAGHHAEGRPGRMESYDKAAGAGLLRVYLPGHRRSGDRSFEFAYPAKSSTDRKHGSRPWGVFVAVGGRRWTTRSCASSLFSIEGDWRRARFLCLHSAGYEAGSNVKYPVLYLLHGFGQVTRSWLDVGFANRILDHLIDEGKARPMIVVMPDAYGGEEILAHGAYWNDAIRTRVFDRFAKSLFEEVIPQVEKEYRAEPGRDARAIAGLSMGGAQSLLIGLNNRDKFSWVGSFNSGGLWENFDQEFPGLKGTANSQLHLLWVACGTDDGLLGINRDFNKWMTGEGITHTAVETPGNHTWMVWRRNLASLAPLLFR
jgi:enterochelin esterase family protein